MIEDMLLPLVCERYKTDPKYRQGHLNVLAPKPGTVVLGLHTPQMKEVAKELSRHPDWQKTLEAFSRENSAKPLTHDERMVWGLMLDYVDCPLKERLHYIDAFIPAIDNWAICDNFCCNAKWLAKLTRTRNIGRSKAASPRTHAEVPDTLSTNSDIPAEDRQLTDDKETVWKWMHKHFAATEEFDRRVSIVLALDYFLEPENIDRTLATIAALRLREGEPYYIQMAVAWLLATALARNPDKTRAFVRAHLPAKSDSHSTPERPQPPNCHSNPAEHHGHPSNRTKQLAESASLPPDIVKRYIRKARESRITRDIPAL